MDQGNLQAIWPHHTPWKEKEQILSEAISKCMKDKDLNGKSQHGFTQGKSCPMNLIAFCDEVTSTVDKQKSVSAVYFDLSKTSNAASCSFLLTRFVGKGDG